MPTIIAGRKPEPLPGFPVHGYSYSSMARFTDNPVLFRIQDMNGQYIDTTQGSNAVLGDAVHHGLKTFLGGNEQYPVPHNDSEALKIALDATVEHMKMTPDGFIKWSANVPTRSRLEELALKTITNYVKEWDRSSIKDPIIVEKKLKESVRVRVGEKEVELPVPLIVKPDLVYEDHEGRLRGLDHKTTFSFSNPDSIDGPKLLQAAVTYLVIYATTGKPLYDFTFREFKVSDNKDGSAQTREYVIVYEEMPIVFDFFFRLYQDITDALLGKQVYPPNLRAMFDRDVAVMAYIYRLDEPDTLEKEKKKARVDDIAHVMQAKMVKTRNLKKFLEAKANLFSTAITLDYKTMQTHERIRYKLMEHGHIITFVDRIEGLSVDLYRYQPTTGVKMTTIEKYQKDIEQITGVSGIRILAPIPNTEYIGFEIPKKKRKFVDLPKVPAGFAIPFGLDVYGERHDYDIREMPHLLVGGTTGSGKSIFLHSLLTQLGRLKVDEVQFILCDPKRIELVDFEDDKHTVAYNEEPQEILSTLIGLLATMEERYKLFKKHRVKNLAQYREKVSTDLPYIVCVVDEFGDLIIGRGDEATEIKNCMIKLAQKARAAGIHLVIATQRPSAKVIDGLIKANFPSRVALKVVSRVDSEIVIDRAGAELLLGKGDMLVQAAGKDLIRLQGFNV